MNNNIYNYNNEPADLYRNIFNQHPNNQSNYQENCINQPNYQEHFINQPNYQNSDNQSNYQNSYNQPNHQNLDNQHNYQNQYYQENFQNNNLFNQHNLNPTNLYNPQINQSLQNTTNSNELFNTIQNTTNSNELFNNIQINQPSTIELEKNNFKNSIFDTYQFKERKDIVAEDTIKTYTNSILVNPNILGQQDLFENDFKNIFSNDKIKEKIDKLGTRIIDDGEKHDEKSLNPPHKMMSEYSQKPDDLLFKNITKNIYAETLQEYTIIIDSIDRDIQKYPNPFSYRVYFNPIQGTKDATIQQKFNYVKYIKLDTGILPSRYYYIKQDTSLNITDFDIVSNLNLSNNPLNSEFFLSSSDVSGTFVIIAINDIFSDNDETITNLTNPGMSGYIYKRYIRFAVPESYPKTVTTVYEFIFTYTFLTPTKIDPPLKINSNFIKIINLPNNYISRYVLQNYNLAYDKYNLLYLDEFNKPNENATNDIIGKSFSVLFPDGCNCDILYVSSGFIDKMFKFSDLGQINLLTINICNSSGKLLKNSPNNYTDIHVPITKICTCLTETNGYFTRNYQCVCTYFRHPYYQKFQNTLVFKIGVIESNIDKTIFS